MGLSHRNRLCDRLENRNVLHTTTARRVIGEPVQHMMLRNRACMIHFLYFHGTNQAYERILCDPCKLGPVLLLLLLVSLFSRGE